MAIKSIRIIPEKTMNRNGYVYNHRKCLEDQLAEFCDNELQQKNENIQRGAEVDNTYARSDTHGDGASQEQCGDKNSAVWSDELDICSLSSATTSSSSNKVNDSIGDLFICRVIDFVELKFHFFC